MAIKAITTSLILRVIHIFFMAECSSALAHETSPMLIDPDINEAYKDCKLFLFESKDDRALSSSVDHFYNLPETYWSQGVHDKCLVTFRSQTLLSMLSTDAHRDGEYVGIEIVRRRYLSASHFCDGKSDYDECLERAVFKYHGFYEVNKNLWKRKVYDPSDSAGYLEKSMSETINGTIRNADGITVISEWRRPYHFPDQMGSDLIVLYVIRRTPFGYVFAGGDYGVAIPVDKTKESQLKAAKLINRIIGVVQSVRMKNSD